MNKYIVIGIIVAGIALIVSGFIGILFKGIHYETARGEHTGYITAVQRHGLIWKTNTVYLKTDTQSSQEDAYCVIDSEVYQKLQQYGTEKQHINAYFFSWLMSGVTNCDVEGQIIYKVEPMAK